MNKTTIRKKLEFKQLMETGTAPLIYPVGSQENSKKRMLDLFDKEIKALYQAKENLLNIPIGRMLLVRTSMSIETNEAFQYKMSEVDLVVTPYKINQYSIRCILWGQEKLSYNISKILRNSNEESKIVLKLTDIITWKLWTPEDAPLTINYKYLTPPYKRLAFQL